MRKKRSGIVRKKTITGELQLSPRGFGFVLAEDGDGDIFIAQHAIHNAWHGDQVTVKLKKRPRWGKRRGQIIRVLCRKHQQLVGKYVKKADASYVISVNPRLPYQLVIEAAKTLGAQADDIVVAQIIRYPDSRQAGTGEIIEVLGPITTPGIDIELVIRNYELRHDFSPTLLAQANRYPTTVTADDINGRLDLRQATIFTIDGASARDFDDAVSLEKLPSGNLRLGVHIADVSHYILPDSPLDKEAYLRGNSVYFPERVLPMLPPTLSNGICSLNPGVDRLTVSVLMEFTPQGECHHYSFTESVIKSQARLTYAEVKAILLDDDQELSQKYKHLWPTLKLMEGFALQLKNKLQQRGSLDFDLPEPEIILDLCGQPQNIIKRERNMAHQLIEMFMLMANETVACHMKQQLVPFLYRIHQPPDVGDLRELAKAISQLEYDGWMRSKLRPQELSQLVAGARGKPTEKVINLLVLRALKLAQYSPQNQGHFGLAMPCYTHFTSPIRRYPDLVVHRLLKQALKGKKPTPKQRMASEERLNIIAWHTSSQERVAEQAEREVVAAKRAQFMADKVGQIFSGTIIGTISRGMLVELQDLYVEGLIPIDQAAAKDYYRHRKLPKHKDKQCHLGQTVMVKVSRVDLEEHRIFFSLEPSNPTYS